MVLKRRRDLSIVVFGETKPRPVDDRSHFYEVTLDSRLKGNFFFIRESFTIFAITQRPLSTIVIRNSIKLQNTNRKPPSVKGQKVFSQRSSGDVAIVNDDATPEKPLENRRATDENHNRQTARHGAKLADEASTSGTRDGNEDCYGSRVRCAEANYDLRDGRSTPT